jgi:hypothetical protein
MIHNFIGYLETMPRIYLTVKLQRGSALTDPEADGVNAFVRLSVPDAATASRVTRVVHNTPEPEWKESFEFICQANQFLLLEVFNYVGGKNPHHLAKPVRVPLTQFRIGEPPHSDSINLFRLKGKGKKRVTAGLLFVQIQAISSRPSAAPDSAFLRATHHRQTFTGATAAPSVLPCGFQWSDHGSDYSTDFSGYSECSETLSDSDPNVRHRHPPVGAAAASGKRAVHRLESIDGTVVRARGLSDPAGNPLASYATVQLLGKGKAKGERVESSVANGANPVWNLTFECPKVRKGYVIEVIVWQIHPTLGHLKIGTVNIALKDLEADYSWARDIPIEQPKDYRKIRGPVEQWGSLQLVLNRTILISDERKLPP